MMYIEDKELVKKVGAFCKKYRVDYLGLSMTEFSDLRGMNIQNINAFEGGRANNIKYLYHYYDQSNENLKNMFRKNIFEVMN